MNDIVRERVCAEVEEQIVVFAIGMRINRSWKGLPLVPAMSRMLKEQNGDSSIGLPSTRPMVGLRNLAVLQLWRSAADLRAYAHDPSRSHLAAWKDFNAEIGTSGGVGIYHETYVVPATNVESVFVNMPRYGLGKAGELFPIRGERANAAKRLRRMTGR